MKRVARLLRNLEQPWSVSETGFHGGSHQGVDKKGLNRLSRRGLAARARRSRERNGPCGPTSV